MNKEQLLSFVRSILLAGSGFIVAKGWMTASDFAALVGAFITIVTVLWGIATKTDKALVSTGHAVEERTRYSPDGTQD